MNKRNLTISTVSLLLVAVVTLLLWQSQNSVPSQPDSTAQSHQQKRKIRDGKQYKSYFDAQTQTTIRYDQLLEGESYRDFISKIPNKRIQTLADNEVQIFVKDGYIQMIKHRPNHYPSKSKIDEFLSEQAKWGWQVTSYQSNAYHIDDDDTMLRFFEYIWLDRRWNSKDFEVEDTFLFMEAKLTEGEPDEEAPIEVFDDCPSILLISSKGRYYAGWRSTKPGYVYPTPKFVSKKYQLMVLPKGKETDLEHYQYTGGGGSYDEEVLGDWKPNFVPGGGVDHSSSGREK